MPTPSATFSALAMTTSISRSARRRGQPLLDHAPAGRREDVCDEEDPHVLDVYSSGEAPGARESSDRDVVAGVRRVLGDRLGDHVGQVDDGAQLRPRRRHLAADPHVAGTRTLLTSTSTAGAAVGRIWMMLPYAAFALPFSTRGWIATTSPRDRARRRGCRPVLRRRALRCPGRLRAVVNVVGGARSRSRRRTACRQAGPGSRRSSGGRTAAAGSPRDRRCRGRRSRSRGLGLWAAIHERSGAGDLGRAGRGIRCQNGGICGRDARWCGVRAVAHQAGRQGGGQQQRQGQPAQPAEAARACIPALGPARVTALVAAGSHRPSLAHRLHGRRARTARILDLCGEFTNAVSAFPVPGTAGPRGSMAVMPTQTPRKFTVPRWVQLVGLPLVVVGLWEFISAVGTAVFIFVVAALIAILLNPIVRAFTRFRLPRAVAVATVYIAFAVILSGIAVVVATVVANQVQDGLVAGAEGADRAARPDRYPRRAQDRSPPALAEHQQPRPHPHQAARQRGHSARADAGRQAVHRPGGGASPREWWSACSRACSTSCW